MINPTAIIHLEDGTTVETPDGPEENVSQIAVWDWIEISDAGEHFLKCHTSDGDMYVPTDSVLEISEIEKN